MKIHFKTFGCKVNQCETAQMRADVLRSGYLISEVIDADLIIINSCTVTSNADNKVKQYLRKCLRINTKARIYVTGCYVDREKSNLENEFSKVNFFLNSKKQNILKVLNLKFAPLTSKFLPVFNNHTRAFIKIQDGCDGKCSYCVVPKVRSRLFSKEIEDIIKEVKSYVSSGYKEIVLCGIRLGKYQAGNKNTLVNLMRALESIHGLYRIRLSSIELLDITDELIELIEKSKKICHHLHIPVQSGDNRILKSMRRPYTTEIFFNKIKNIRKKITDIGITTDIIVGYPLDNEISLKNTYNFAKKCRFSRIHIFRYSKRPDTEASMLKNECNNILTDKWSKKITQLDLWLRKNLKNKFLGKKMEILAETNGFGYTSNYIYVKIPKSILPNEI